MTQAQPEKKRKEHEFVYVEELPKCDLCGKVAQYDARIPSYGSWGNLCKTCFKMNNCLLGLGKGQELLVKGES